MRLFAATICLTLLAGDAVAQQPAEPAQPSGPPAGVEPAPAAPTHSAAEQAELKQGVAKELSVKVEEFLRRNDVAGAMKLIDQALARDGSNFALYRLRANANCLLGKIDPCLEDLNRAINGEKEFVPAYLQRAMVQLDKQQTRAALADCETAIKLWPERAEGYNCRGVVNRMLGNYPQALADLDNALNKNPKFWIARYQKGFVYALQEKNQQAIASFTAALAINDKDADSYAQRGKLRSSGGDVEGARADFAKALALNGRNHTAAVGMQALQVGKALDVLSGKK
jgi:tetratricopeptide (TPR) repeat protein